MRPSAYYTGFEEERHPPHFLDSCSLCRRPIGQNSDIYMYRGDKPFCSQECRQEQIEMDEADERKMKLAAKRALRQNKESSSTKESETNKAVRRGTTVAVA